VQPTNAASAAGRRIAVRGERLVIGLTGITTPGKGAGWQ
jgi:hypothetical protein